MSSPPQPDAGAQNPMQAVRQLNEEVVKLEAEVLRYLKNCRVLAPPRTVYAECLF